ncbi:MAG: lipopolysaccharide heptosyltransferase II [Porticoccaceae bacterium]
MVQESGRKILIVGPSWVGDMVMAQSLFTTLKQNNPGCIIDVLAPGWSRPILARMPEVNSSIDMPVGHGSLMLGKRRRLGHALRAARYDQAILLPNSLKSALVPWFAKIPLRTGWKGEFRYGLLNDLRQLDKQKYPLMVQRFDALAYADGDALPEKLPTPALQIDPHRSEALREKFGLGAESKVLALCPGAEFGPAKRWPEQHYAAVAEAKIAQGWRVWLLGSAKDQAVANSIIGLLPEEQQCQAHNLAGVTQLDDAIDLLAVADAVVSNDSGLMHIAAALNRPLVVVYGSTSPKFTPPLSDNVAILSIPVDCGPCFERECPLQHMKCLNDLLPLKVIEALAHLVGGSSEGSCPDDCSSGASAS